jgi:hypothetical protein
MEGREMTEEEYNISSRRVPFIVLFLSIGGMVYARDLYDIGIIRHYAVLVLILLILTGIGAVSLLEFFRISDKWKKTMKEGSEV